MNELKGFKNYFLLTLMSVLSLGTEIQAQNYSDYPELYARAADEYVVTFQSEIKTDFKSLDVIAGWSDTQKNNFIEYIIKPTLKYLYGPLTLRSLGGEQKGTVVSVEWSKAYLNSGTVVVPYNYKGQWLVNNRAEHLAEFSVPVPYSYKLLKTPQWTKCTDREHQDYDSYWYYWDPERVGCDQTEGVEYQIIKPNFTRKTQQTVTSYPEYERMIADGVMSLTFAFGYVEDSRNPDPFRDTDYGMGQFRSFISSLRGQLSQYKVQESPVLEQKYLGSLSPNKKIGTQFSFFKNDVKVVIKVVASADIDQMELFTMSFAHEHDDYFSWFGHSRVGNGFDANMVARMLRNNRDFYTVTQNYQLVYWAGCNSYSYYTKPFFDLKSQLSPKDPSGTKSLDIISNGLPSYFSLNAANALVLSQALINFESPTSFQEIVNRIEIQSNQMGIYVLANVLGDEDN